MGNIPEYTSYAIVILVALFGLRTLLQRFGRGLIVKNVGKDGIHAVDKLSGYEFEEYLKLLFRKMKYESISTQKKGDFGVDIIIKGKKKKVAVQAKRHGDGHKVGINAVQEVYAGMVYYDADEAWVVTNRTYTWQAKELAKACGVRLVDRTELLRWVKGTGELDRGDIDITYNVVEHDCPVCKTGKMVVRNGYHGRKFYGCSNYPKCKNTEEVEVRWED
ncbi:restriction endonuclease [Bacillus cereus group sp. MYBK15-3]|uniref:restriction endonuclease n=1 Tax=Bacillus cereus group TaxID=86661 RepID=UPI001C8B8F3F|nr:restriction endonuclease [Bacillus cereus]MBX9158383.1 restriction endonuclease [Bacillus cereus]